ncbi:MAG: peptide chain release factor N(5)-glutamine methyltransferase [Mediterranea sp.]|jgi:release factor glutamine methyltransferase|nr:peptide chain release factor N(5)-glutamine methyltransferase [Mediterranea sp.]
MNITPRQVKQLLLPVYTASEAGNLARLLCCELWGQSTTDYYLDKSITLSADAGHQWQNILARLLQNEPIQYILQEARFLGQSFRVTPATLIPRPETEELVERMLTTVSPEARILDIGTGSGCIAVSLSRALPAAEVEAWDVSEEALAVARVNGKMLQANVRWVCRDVWDDAPDDTARFDVIVSNPPYVTESEKSAMERNVLEWEPATALFVPDNDPLRFYRRIAALGCRMLLPGGQLFFEINRAYGVEVRSMLHDSGYRHVTLWQDISRNDRFIEARL